MPVIWKGPARRELAGLDRTQAARVLDAVDRFAATGYGDVKALKGSTEKRLRIGDYRVLFDYDGSTVTVLHVAHRREAYR